MPDITIASSEVSSGRIALVPDEVSTVTFAANVGVVQVIADGTAAVYYTVDGTEPTVDGPNTFELPAGLVAVDERTTRNATEGDVVKLISDGAPTVRVQAL